MNIHEQQSLISLWFATFGVVNRSIGSLLKAVILLIILPLGLLGVLGFFIAKENPIMAMVLGAGAALYVVCIGLMLSVILYRLLNEEVEQTKTSLTAITATSFVPAIYVLVYSIGMGILSAAVSYVGHLIDSAFVMGILNVALFFCITLRLMYTPMAIAVRDMGPIEAVTHSWRLTSGKGYMKTLGMWLMTLLLPALLIVGGVLLAYAAYVCIPLYFSSNFDISHLTWPWYLAAVLLGIVALFFSLCMFAYPFLVFLNLDSLLYQQEWGAVSEVHIVEEKPKVQQKSFAYQQQDEEDDNVEDLIIEHSSVKNDAHADALSAHLDQVYQKSAHNHVVEYTEEDRMPTIMFDDEMAKQLEENRKMWEKPAANPKSSDTSEDGGTIKMSK